MRFAVLLTNDEGYHAVVPAKESKDDMKEGSPLSLASNLSKIDLPTHLGWGFRVFLIVPDFRKRVDDVI